MLLICVFNKNQLVYEKYLIKNVDFQNRYENYQHKTACKYVQYCNRSDELSILHSKHIDTMILLITSLS